MHEFFLSLCATHYGFEPKVCVCASQHEIGSCEKSISVIRRTELCEKMQFEPLDEDKLHLISSLNSLNRYPVYRRTKMSIQLLEGEGLSATSAGITIIFEL